MNISRALIIDDEKNIRLTLSKCLSYRQISADEAINGEEGLQKVAADDYDIVFLDLKMPGMDGLEVLKRIKQIKPDLSVVIITAHGTVDYAVDAMKLGASDFMQKPFTPSEIQKIVEEISARKSLHGEALESYEAHLQYAKEQISKMEYENAIEHLKQSIAKGPGQAEPYSTLGAIYEIMGELEEAKKHYKVALALDPGFPQAQRNLIRITEKMENDARK